MMSILCDKFLIIANIMFEGRRINIYPRRIWKTEEAAIVYSFIHVFTHLANSYQLPPKPLRL